MGKFFQLMEYVNLIIPKIVIATLFGLRWFLILREILYFFFTF